MSQRLCELCLETQLESTTGPRPWNADSQSAKRQRERVKTRLGGTGLRLPWLQRDGGYRIPLPSPAYDDTWTG